MTWMIIRLVLSLAFIAIVLFYAARLAKKKGLGQGNGLIEVVARQRMGRTSTINLVRIGDVVLVVGATEEQVTLLAEVDAGTIERALDDSRRTVRIGASEVGAPGVGASEVGLAVIGTPGLAARASSGALAGSVFDRNGWGAMVHQLRERTVRRS